MKYILLVIIALNLASCSITRDLTKSYPLETAAIADTISTEIAMRNGFVELNPLGPDGALLGKILILASLPYLSEKSANDIKCWASPIWIGGAANNVSLVVIGDTVLAPVLGIAAGIYYWKWIDEKYNCISK